MYVKTKELCLIWFLKIITYVKAIKVDFKQSLAVIREPFRVLLAKTAVC